MEESVRSFETRVLGYKHRCNRPVFEDPSGCCAYRCPLAARGGCSAGERETATRNECYTRRIAAEIPFVSVAIAIGENAFRTNASYPCALRGRWRRRQISKNGIPNIQLMLGE
jgi:hypothetical protein